MILGSFVGTDEFILKQLEEYGKELERVADCLLSYPDFLALLHSEATI